MVQLLKYLIKQTKKYIASNRGNLEFLFAYSIDKYIKSGGPKTEHLVKPEGTLKCNEKEKRISNTRRLPVT